MKTAHYLLALAAFATVSIGGIVILNAQDKAPAAPAAPAAEAKPAAPADPNFGFASLEDRFAYAVGFQQAQSFSRDPKNKVNAEAFLKGFKAGLDGEDASYAHGLLMAAGAKAQGVNVKFDVFAEGARAGAKGGTGRLTQAQLQQTFQEFGQAQQAKAETQAKAEADKAKAAGVAYLAENGKKEGWKTSSSGLQYKIITAGEGAHPTAKDVVKVHYAGRLIDGTEFDSSYKRGEPIEFELGNLIPAWVEAVPMLGKGGKIELAVPAALGYGERGSPPTIPGGATLLFTVELLDFHAPAPHPAGKGGFPGGND